LRLTPADFVIGKLGGVRQAAKKLKYSPSAVSRWRTSGGEIPTKARKKILKYSGDHELEITPDHLEYGFVIFTNSKRK
jgi:hypothetical protein